MKASQALPRETLAALAGGKKAGITSTAGLFRAVGSPGKPGSVSSSPGVLSIKGITPSFTKIMQSKLADAVQKKDAQVPPQEKLREALENALKKLRAGNIPEAVSLEKSFQEALEDARLSPKQRAARLKELLKEAKDLLSAQQTMVAALVKGPGGAGSREAGQTVKPQEPSAQPAVSADVTRKSTEPRIYLVDLRKNSGQGTGSDWQGQKLAPVQTMEKDAGSQLSAQQKVFAQRETTDAVAPQKAPQSPVSATPLERLREMAGAELARTAGIVLREGGGEIRLVLKPESLGSIRVRLNLVDNVIDGKIVVDSTAVKHVLEGSMDSLTRALSADGFQTASLQVSVGGGDARGDRRDEERTALRVQSTEGFNRAVPDAERFSGWDELLVNLFA